MFLFWRALPILRKARCAQSMAPFRCHCYIFSCFCDRTWGWIKYNFLSLHFPGGHPKWRLCVPLVSFHEALLLKGQGHHYRHQKFVQWSRMLVLKQNFLSLWPALSPAAMVGRTEFLPTSAGDYQQHRFPVFSSEQGLPSFNVSSTCRSVIQQEASGFRKHLCLSPFYPRRS